MDKRETLTETERLLLMAAAVHGLGPATDTGVANTARVVDQVLRWRGLSAEEIRFGWCNEDCAPIHNEVYDALIGMVHEAHRAGPGRPGVLLFEGGGNWGIPGDPRSPACSPQFNSCRLTAEGERVARELLERHPEYRRDTDPGRGMRRP